ncbi:MAG: hypothetical protein AAGD04_02665 [Pseudomonadota bacterium]
MTIIHSDPLIRAHVRNLVMSERQRSRTDKEWQNRLAGFGYAVESTEVGTRVVTLTHRVEVCTLPIFE